MDAYNKNETRALTDQQHKSSSYIHSCVKKKNAHTQWQVEVKQTAAEKKCSAQRMSRQREQHPSNTSPQRKCRVIRRLEAERVTRVGAAKGFLRILFVLLWHCLMEISSVEGSCETVLVCAALQLCVV